MSAVAAQATGSATVLDVAKEKGNFNTLAKAIEVAGLQDALSGNGPVTIFAPTDEAFAKLPPAQLEALLRPENKDQLVKILTHHVVPGKALETDDMKRSRSAKTVAGEDLKFELVRGRLRVDGARVTGDYNATNGVVVAVDSVLLPMADYAADLHSGGSSLVYTPCALGNLFEGETARNAKVLELLRVFGAPVSYVAKKPMGADRAFGASARRRGVVAIGTEAGGGGTVSPLALRIAQSGLHRVLRHLGMVPGLEVEASTGTRLVEVGGSDYFVYSTERGLVETLVAPGDEVVAGQAAARIHFPYTPWREAETVHFERSGLVLCKRVPGRTERGDCLFHLGTDLAG
jgi:uncharacterized surface protein with fasciclin (FAS1) repeats